MDLREELFLLLERARAADGYQNPHFVVAILNAIEDHTTIEDSRLDGLHSWAQDLWSQ